MNANHCKICNSGSLVIYAHTAKCRDCGVLLYYPYPITDDNELASEGTFSGDGKALRWYKSSSFFNHTNFTNMIRFTMDKTDQRHLDILDYGGGGGQFALVFKSHFPESSVYIADINDDSLLDEWRPLNKQIPFREFESNDQKFDVIFMNDVYEHVSDPVNVLKLLSTKLKSNGKIFIDTPKQFWIYPLTKWLYKPLYTKVLKGTVSTAHLQIWSKKSFDYSILQSGLKVKKYREISEYTMPPSYYLRNMGINNPLIKLAGAVFYSNAKYIAKNKIICVLSK